MDIDYLLLLQNLRNSLPSWIADVGEFITDFAVSFWPLCLICFVYWVLDRKGGKRILAGFGCGMLINGFLKLVFCVYRPWIRDARIEPYGDAKTGATGYSFPSGHSTWATATLGGTGFWARKKSRVVSILFYVLAFCILFSRNFLGVHTPQDVIIGCLSTVLMMFAASWIENWTDKDPNRDKTVLFAGIALCVALVLFYMFKSYPLTYLEDGSLLVDPVKMQADSFEGIGFISAYVIVRYFERRHFRFDTLLPTKIRALIAIPACVPIALWKTYSVSFFTELVNRSFAKFMLFSVFVVYVMIFIPWIMSLIGKRYSAKKQAE